MGLSRASGVDPFFSLSRFDVDSSIDGNGSSLGFSIGGDTVSGTITATTLQVAAGASLSLANSGGNIRQRLQVAPRGSIALDFGFNASIFGESITTGSSPRVQFTDTNLFDSNFPTPNLELDPLRLNLSGEALLNALVKLADWLNEATDSSACQPRSRC